MLKYLSKPDGTHGVFPGTRSQGGYDIVKLKPGTVYIHGYPKDDFIGERDSFHLACEWADACDGITNPYA